MNIKVPNGRYVVAVSGGVDSTSLLHMLSQKPQLELVVAHFNHGIRADAATDEKLVRATALKYGLKFEIGHGHLGSKASEEKARVARYKFLESVRKKHRARAIITAHHQDDLIETALVNILRGTGRRGLSAIAHNPKVIRPLLQIPKEAIIKYAKVNELHWREDSTNWENLYLRNYLRQHILVDLKGEGRQELLDNLDKVAKINSEINRLIATLSQAVKSGEKVKRQAFTLLPTAVGEELVMYWLRELDLKQFDKKTVKRLVNALRTAQPNTRHEIYKGWWLIVNKSFAHFTNSLK